MDFWRRERLDFILLHEKSNGKRPSHQCSPLSTSARQKNKRAASKSSAVLATGIHRLSYGLAMCVWRNRGIGSPSVCFHKDIQSEPLSQLRGVGIESKDIQTQSKCPNHPKSSRLLQKP